MQVIHRTWWERPDQLETPRPGAHERFTRFALDVRTLDALVRDGTTMSAQQRRSRGRLAVIDDDTAFLQLMHDLLADEENFEVLIHREWDYAYEFVKEQRPDLVILDIRIGGEERGWTILNLLTLDPITRPIPIIVCSAAIQSLHEHQPWLDKFGICALPKPFDLEMLLEMVDRVLAQERDGPDEQIQK
ncbi:MAG: response regulator [Chloroflexi bacterium]|nr:response regulator [Chloroflexota bacterium]